MKKILITLILIYVFSFIPVKADLTDKQATDIAFFAEKFVTEGNKRISDKGFSLFAYGQVPGRKYGFVGKLYDVTWDFKGIYKVNEPKWVFDCSSFTSYIYYHLFGLVLTTEELNEVDSYSGLKLMNPTMNLNQKSGNTPYHVIKYVEDAENSKHFYFISENKNKKIKNFNFNILKPGDLIIIIGDDSNHIVLYLGDGKIAHASTSEIKKPNLGMNIANLIDKYGNKTASVIRLKNGIIDPNKKANLILTWPDNNETIDFNKLRYVNDIPKITYALSKETWTNELELSFILSDEDGISNYSFSDNETPNFIQATGKKITFSKKILKNGIYYIVAKDILDNIHTEKIIVNNLDVSLPVVTINEQKNDNNTLITINANDSDSGLDILPYSFDNGVAWTDVNTYEINDSGLYSICVRDKAGNIFKKDINITINDTIPPEILNINYGKIIGTTQEVVINANDSGSGIKGYAIKSDNNITIEDADWKKLNVDTYTTYLPSGKYYIWIIDNCNNISKYDIINVDLKNVTSDSNFSNILIIIFSAIILSIIGYIVFKNVRKNHL